MLALDRTIFFKNVLFVSKELEISIDRSDQVW